MRAWADLSIRHRHALGAEHLERVLQPIAESMGIEGVTFQSLRRTCSTYFKGDIKSAQAQLRHAKPQMTANEYMQTITEDHRKAVEKAHAVMRAECEAIVTEKNPVDTPAKDGVM